MKIFIISIMLFLQSSVCFSQLTVYTYYASCGNPLGRFSIRDCNGCDSVVWWNGITAVEMSAPPGSNYSATFYTNGVLTGGTGSLTMILTDWELNIIEDPGPRLYFSAFMAACPGGMSYGPICSPTYFNPDFQMIFWEDMIAIDTFTSNNCTSTNGFYYNVRAGHTYDLSIYDPGCNCFKGTWDYSPPRSVTISTTGLRENKNNELLLSLTQSSSFTARLKYAGLYSASALFKFYSVEGKELINPIPLQLSEIPGEQTIDISQLNSGLYLGILTGEGIHQTVRFVKQ